MMQLVGRLFRITILCTETSNASAIPRHVSPSLTVYSNGGCSVSVGINVWVGASVPVGVIVPVADGVTSTVDSVRVVPVRPACRLKYTAAAPINIIVTSAPNAAGRLSVISGIRLAWTFVSAFFDFVVAFAVSSVPHTRQRVAFSLRRVPQVGHTFVFCDEGSWSIRAEIIPLNPFHPFERIFRRFPYEMIEITGLSPLSTPLAASLRKNGLQPLPRSRCNRRYTP